MLKLLMGKTCACKDTHLSYRPEKQTFSACLLCPCFWLCSWQLSWALHSLLWASAFSNVWMTFLHPQFLHRPHQYKKLSSYVNTMWNFIHNTNYTYTNHGARQQQYKVSVASPYSIHIEDYTFKSIRICVRHISTCFNVFTPGRQSICVKIGDSIINCVKTAFVTRPVFFMKE